MFKLLEKITVWKELSNDGGGGKTWSRVKLDARHANRIEQFKDSSGKISVSKTVVYAKSNTALTVGSMVLIGESVQSTPTVDADEIKAISSTPGDIDLLKIWL